MALISALRPVQNGCKLADGVLGVLLVWTPLYCCSIVLLGLFRGPNKQNACIGSDDGLVPSRQNAIVGTKDRLLLMHMCATRPKWVNVIFPPGFTVISTPLKGTWYVWRFVLLCLNDYHKISFLTEDRESSIRRLVVAGGNLGCHYDNMWCQ